MVHISLLYCPCACQPLWCVPWVTWLVHGDTSSELSASGHVARSASGPSYTPARSASIHHVALATLQGDAFSESGTAKLADFGLSRILGHRSLPQPPPASHASAPRSSGSGSLDLMQPSAPGTPSSADSTGSRGSCSTVDAGSQLFEPRPRETSAPPSLKARTSSIGERPTPPGHSAPAGAPSARGYASYLWSLLLGVPGMATTPSCLQLLT